MSSLANTSANVLAAKAKRDNAFRKKGIIIALFSGFLYGGYTAYQVMFPGGCWLWHSLGLNLSHGGSQICLTLLFLMIFF